jgi:hypothetical protein
VSSSDEDLVERYLARLNAAAASMPSDRRQELIDEIAAHIDEARAASPNEPGGVRTVLDQLGSPEEIVRAAGASSARPDRHPSSSRLGPLEIVTVIALLVGGIVIPFVGWVVGVVLLWISPRWRTRDKLLGTFVWPGGLLAPVVVFFAVGAAAVLTTGAACSGNASVSGIAISATGTVSEFEHGAPAFSCTPPTVQPWLAITLAVAILLVSVAGPILVAIRLLRQARPPAAPADELETGLLAPTLSV